MSKEFRFGPQHVGREVYHNIGKMIGIIEKADPSIFVESVQLVINWSDGTRRGYYLNGRWSEHGPIVVFLSQTYTVVDQLNDIHYTPGGGANFRLTVSVGTTEHTAAVDLFEFLMWAQADGLIDSYSAEEPHKESVILPVPDEQQNHRATAQVKRLYVWLQQLPLTTFTRALNERPAMWSSFDQNMEPIN